jgi:inosine-uridine nucleoside N-ribohydrolase
VIIHLDTDFGGDIDDLCALAMLLALPEVEITGITTTIDEGGRRSGYVKYVLGLAGRTEIPVAAGADVALGRFRWRPGYYDDAAYWPEVIPPSPNPLDDALDLIEQSVARGATIVGIGPYTNLALFDERRPRRLAAAPLYLMGFFVRPIPRGFPQWGIETDWNVQSDAAAAQRLLETCAPTIIPCEMTLQTSLRRAYLPGLRAAGPVGALIARQAEALARDERNEERIGRTCAGLPDDTINFLHDPLAGAVAVGWDSVSIETIPVRGTLDDAGFLHTVATADGKPTRVVTGVDGARFSDWWQAVLTRTI